MYIIVILLKNRVLYFMLTKLVFYFKPKELNVFTYFQKVMMTFANYAMNVAIFCVFRSMEKVTRVKKKVISEPVIQKLKLNFLPDECYKLTLKQKMLLKEILLLICLAFLKNNY